MKINVDLNQEEVQTLFDLLNNEIIKHGPLARLDALEGKISKEELD